MDIVATVMKMLWRKLGKKGRAEEIPILLSLLVKGLHSQRDLTIFFYQTPPRMDLLLNLPLIVEMLTSIMMVFQTMLMMMTMETIFLTTWTLMMIMITYQMS